MMRRHQGAASSDAKDKTAHCNVVINASVVIVTPHSHNHHHPDTTTTIVLTVTDIVVLASL